MDIKILVTSLIVILGWLVAHILTQQREQIRRRQDKRIEYLINAYKNLEASSNRDDTEKYKDGVESAIADIHLFGTETQIQLANNFSQKIATEGGASIDELLLQLREDLRKELKLSKTSRKLNYLRLVRD